MRVRAWSLVLALLATPLFAAPVGTAFTYQGELRSSATHAPVADGAYDFEFHLFDDAAVVNELALQTKDDVAVAGGLFSVDLDFTDVPFALSQAYWLEVRVRPGAEGGAFQALLPRQRITPTPYAINARGVQDGGVGNAALIDGAVSADKIGAQQVGAAQIADGAIDSDKLSSNAVTSAAILDGSVGSAEIDATQVQRRVAACGAGAAIQAIAQDGTVTCESAGAGTVTSIDTAGGLSGGPIVSSGTLSIADGGVTSSKILDGTVGSVDIDAAQVQRRVAACAAGGAIQAIAQDGTVTCQSAGAGTVSSIDTGAGLTGGPITTAGTISIADEGVTSGKIADGAIASVDVLDGGLQAEDLADNSVGSGEVTNNALTADDLATSSVGSDEIADGTVASVDIVDNSIGTLDIGNGSIASVDIQDSSIAANDVNNTSVQWRVSQSCSGAIRQINADGTVVCNAAAASTVRPVQPLVFSVPTIAAGGASSVVIGVDGLPLISVHDTVAGNLVVVHCENPACSAATTTTIDNAANDVGAFNSIAIDGRGFGAVAYYDATAGDLKLALCADLACTSATLRTLDSTDDVGKFAAIGFDATNLVAIAYFDETNDNLKFARCTNATCSTSAVGTVDGSANDVGRALSLMTFNGIAVIAYADATAGSLKLARCSIVSECTMAIAAISDLDAAAGSFSTTAVTLAARGTPVIFYQRPSGDLYVVRCLLRTCNSIDAPAAITTFGATISHLAASTDALGRIHLVTVVGDQVQTLRCYEELCTGTPVAQNGVIYSTAVGGADARPSIALGHHGFPIVTARNGVVTRIIVCDNHLCTTGSRPR